MFKNYLTVAVRNIWNNKSYSFLNIAGLAVGLTCSIIILLWVEDELSYDRFHKNADQLYFVRENQTYEGKTATFIGTPGPLAEGLKLDFSQIEQSTRVSWENTILFTYQGKNYKENGHYVDPSFLEMFTFPLLSGDPKTALSNIHSVVISKTMAEKFFGTKDPVGSTIRLNNKLDYRITGVAADVPQNSTIKFDFLLPFSALVSENTWLNDWRTNAIQTYVKLREGTTGEAASGMIVNYLNKHGNPNWHLLLQPVSEMYLYSDYKDGKNIGGRISYVRVFVIVALLIMVIACINFMNLSTARSQKRSKEVGIRKAMGALRGLIVRQFLSESLLTTSLSLVLALILTALLSPFFGKLLDKELSIYELSAWNWLVILSLAICTGLLAGSYPAVYLSAFNPVQVLKGTMRSSTGAVRFRQVLVVGQFIASIILIVSAIVVFQQINFLQNRPLGYDKEQLVLLPMQGSMKENYESVKRDLLGIKGISSVTRTSQPIHEIGNNTDAVEWAGKSNNQSILFSVVEVDYDFSKTFGMQVKNGRDFAQEMGADSLTLLVNEESVKRMGMTDPIGKTLKYNDKSYTIVGLLKDFHFNSVYSPIQPLVIQLAPKECSFIFVKMDNNVSLSSTLSSIEGVQRKFNPAYPFEYRFLEDELDKKFKSEQQLGQLAACFAILALIISSLGLFGLAMFTAEQRRSEIGVRKVLGATVSSILMLLVKEFVRLVMIALVVAVPLVWYVTREWLSTFAYHIEVSWFVFALTGLLTLFVTVLTVSFQSLKAALANPVRSLRS